MIDVAAFDAAVPSRVIMLARGARRLAAIVDGSGCWGTGLEAAERASRCSGRAGSKTTSSRAAGSDRKLRTATRVLAPGSVVLVTHAVRANAALADGAPVPASARDLAGCYVRPEPLTPALLARV